MHATAVVTAWIDGINCHDPAAIEATLHEEFVWELGSSTTTGAHVSAEAWRMWFEGFPDFRFEPIQTLSDGETVCTRARMTGTHSGPFRFRGTDSLDDGLAPSGRKFDLPGCAVHAVENRRIRRLWAYWDTATLIRQISG
jgi:predicted ester cyclase